MKKVRTQRLQSASSGGYFHRSIFTIATSLELAVLARLDVDCVSEHLNQTSKEISSHCHTFGQPGPYAPSVETCQ